MHRQTGPTISKRVIWLSIFGGGLVCLLSLLLSERLILSGRLPLGDAPTAVLVSLYLFVAQDRWAGPIFAGLILAAWSVAALRPHSEPIQWPRWTVPALALFGTVCGTLLRFLAHHDYDLSLDEFMPAFQAEIFRAGHLAAELSPDLFALHDRLQPAFTYVDTEHRLWMSNYRPIHAALLALFPASIDTAALHGLLAGVSVLAMADIARRVFPDRPEAPVMAALLLLGSSQFLITAASGFSFAAHLAFNLVWLSLFLRGSWGAHCLAALVGAFAIGLHQVHVHLFFALPFGLAMLVGRFGSRWKALPYIGLYAAVLPIWLAWPEISVWLETGDAAVLPRSLAEIYYITDYFRAEKALDSVRDAYGPTLLMGDLWRYLLWIAPAFAPLLVLAPACAGRMGALPLVAGLGVLMMIVLVYLLMPLQAHGWGARYYHPVLGNVVLVGLATLYALPEGELARRMRRTILLLALSGIVVLVPWRSLQVEAKVGPRAAVQAQLSALDADAVALTPFRWFSTDLIRNDPFLRNRPLILRDRGDGVSLPGLAPPLVLDRAALTEMGLPQGTYLEP